MSTKNEEPQVSNISKEDEEKEIDTWIIVVNIILFIILFLWFLYSLKWLNLIFVNYQKI